MVQDIKRRTKITNVYVQAVLFSTKGFKISFTKHFFFDEVLSRSSRILMCLQPGSKVILVTRDFSVPANNDFFNVISRL